MRGLGAVAVAVGAMVGLWQSSAAAQVPPDPDTIFAEHLCKQSFPDDVGPSPRMTSVAPTSVPTASLSTTGILSAALSVGGKEKATVLNVAPFRPTAWSALWGLQTSLGYDASAETVLVGGAYRIDWSWLLGDRVDQAYLQERCVARLKSAAPLLYWSELKRIEEALAKETDPPTIMLGIQDAHRMVDELRSTDVARSDVALKTALSDYPDGRSTDIADAGAVRGARDESIGGV